MTRPALSHQRLSHTKTGAVGLQLKTPYRNGTTHLVMSPLECLQHLAALVPRPRLHLIRFHGVLAPNAALRSQIVPGPAEPASARQDDEPPASTQTRRTWAPLLTRVFAVDLTTGLHCGGPLALMAAIEEPAAISTIFTHLGLPSRAPPKAPTRLNAFFQTASPHDSSCAHPTDKTLAADAPLQPPATHANGAGTSTKWG